MLYALTDFLVVIGVAIAVWRIWHQRPDSPTVNLLIGLSAFALAATIGTVRFATGAIDALQAQHSYWSAFAGVSGLLLIAISSVRLTWLSGRRHRLDQGILVALIAGYFGASAVLSATMIAPIALLLGLSSTAWLAWRQNWRPALFWLASWLLLIFASTAIGSLREEITFGIANWHIYHALLAIWAVLVGEAVRASTSTRA
ncbi:MAG: hypothetical protein GYB36_02315 [Alphaproteobacteria bacterium]|nr:hypothetical protein [Alphaproteobacteria bacterium]